MEAEWLARRLRELLGAPLDELLEELELLDERLDAGMAHGESGGFTARTNPAPMQETSISASPRRLSQDLPGRDLGRIVAPEFRSKGDTPDQD